MNVIQFLKWLTDNNLRLANEDEEGWYTHYINEEGEKQSVWITEK